MGDHGAPTARHLCDLTRQLRRRPAPQFPDPPRPHHSPPVGIAAVSVWCASRAAALLWLCAATAASGQTNPGATDDPGAVVQAICRQYAAAQTGMPVDTFLLSGGRLCQVFANAPIWRGLVRPVSRNCCLSRSAWCASCAAALLWLFAATAAGGQTNPGATTSTRSACCPA